MRKPYTVSDSEIKHYVPPELKGNIVGLRDEAVRPQTVEEIEALQKQVTEEARKEGYEAGLKQGLQEMNAEAQKLQQVLQSIISFLQKPIEEMDQQVESQLTEMTMFLAKQLLKKENSLDEKHIQKLVHESLEYLPAKANNIRVRLNPSDIEMLNNSDIDMSEQTWEYVADASVSASGCIIESDTSHIDATMETRIEQLVEQLGIKTSTGESDAAE